MPVSRLLLPLFAVLLLAGTPGRAQSRRGAPTVPAEPQYQEVTVSVVLPKAVGLIRDYGKILLSRGEGESKWQRLTNQLSNKPSRPVVEVIVGVPKNWVTRKAQPGK